MKHFLEASRSIVYLGIGGTFLASIALFLFGFANVVVSVLKALTVNSPFSDESLKQLSITLIQVIDVFLLATVFYIIALGLYELFIDDGLELPVWLQISTLDDLKARLLGVVVVILPVTFLGKLVDWKAGIDILWLGLAVAVVTLAIAAAQFITVLKHRR